MMKVLLIVFYFGSSRACIFVVNKHAHPVDVAVRRVGSIPFR
jgi:hypothetical protein